MQGSGGSVVILTIWCGIAGLVLWPVRQLPYLFNTVYVLAWVGVVFGLCILRIFVGGGRSINLWTGVALGITLALVLQVFSSETYTSWSMHYFVFEEQEKIRSFLYPLSVPRTMLIGALLGYATMYVGSPRPEMKARAGRITEFAMVVVILAWLLFVNVDMPSRSELIYDQGGDLVRDYVIQDFGWPYTIASQSNYRDGSTSVEVRYWIAVINCILCVIASLSVGHSIHWLMSALFKVEAVNRQTRAT